RHLVAAGNSVWRSGRIGVGIAGRSIADCCCGASGGAGARDIKFVKRVWVLLITRLCFQNDAVLVCLAIDRRNLALAKGVIERISAAVYGHASPSRLFAIDVHLHAGTALLSLRRDLLERRISAQTANELVCPFNHFVTISGHERILILSTARAR